MSEDKLKPGDVVEHGDGESGPKRLIRCLKKHRDSEGVVGIESWLVLCENLDEAVVDFNVNPSSLDIVAHDSVFARELAVEEAELAEREAKDRFRFELSRTPLHKESVVDRIKGKRPECVVIDDAIFDRIVSSTDLDQGVKTTVRMGVKNGRYTILDVSQIVD